MMHVVPAEKVRLTMRLAIPRFDPSGIDDDVLVGLARLNDEDAVRTLVSRHNRRLFRVARSVIRDDAEAEDVVQEGYVRAFTNLEAFRGESLFSTWLTRIVLNEALGRARRRRPRVDLRELDDARIALDEGQLIMFPQTPANPESETARHQIRVMLEQGVDRLPDLFRIVFVLRDVEGLSVEETALQLSIRPETVKTRLHRARRLMRAMLEERLSPAFADLFPFDGARCAGMADRVVERLRGETAHTLGRHA